jgi:hypothetical protein
VLVMRVMATGQMKVRPQIVPLGRTNVGTRVRMWQRGPLCQKRADQQDASQWSHGSIIARGEAKISLELFWAFKTLLKT